MSTVDVLAGLRYVHGYTNAARSNAEQAASHLTDGRKTRCDELIAMLTGAARPTRRT